MFIRLPAPFLYMVRALYVSIVIQMYQRGSSRGTIMIMMMISTSINEKERYHKSNVVINSLIKSATKIIFCTQPHHHSLCFRKGGQNGGVLCQRHRHSKDKV